MRQIAKGIGLAAAVLALTVGAAGQARAGLVTSSAGFAQGAQIVNFSQFGDFSYGTGTVQVGGLVNRNITWESSNYYAVIGNGGYALGSNGYWNSSRNGYVGINTSDPNHSMTFRFKDGLVSEVGGFVNYAPNSSGFLIQALASNGSILESYNVTALAPISTPGQNDAGAFRGITRATADIAAFRLSGAFDVLDDLTFTYAPTVVPVPEPTTIAGGILAGLVSIGYCWRRRGTQSSSPMS